MLKKIFSASSILATCILMVYGLIEITLKVRTATNSVFLTVGTMALILCALVGPFVYYYLARPRVLKEFGLGRRETQFICLENTKEIRIWENYQAKATVKRKLVFMKPPSQTDLVDCYSIDPQLSIDEFPYESPDAEEVDRKQQTPSRLAIFWRPKKPIYPYREYIHQDSWIPPVSYNAPANYTEYHCNTETGIFRVTVHTPSDIERAIVFQRPHWRRLNNDLEFMKYALQGSTRSCPQAIIHPDKKGFVWEIVNAKVGESYICVFFYQGGTEYWQNQILNRRLINRLKSKIQVIVAKIRIG